MANIDAFDRVKRILKRMPGMQRINGTRRKLIRLGELSALIKANRIVVVDVRSWVGKDGVIIQALVQEVLREWLDHFGIVHLKRSTANEIDAPTGAALLYAPQALLRIPASHEDYLKGVERETRRVIRIAGRQGYEFKGFNWNDHLDEIFEINTSEEMRQSEPMRGWYRDPVQPRHHSEEELRYRKYYGAFKDGRLYAYFHFYICGEIAIGKHFIGHSQHLRWGIMNGLISHAVGECIKDSQIRWLNYGEWWRKGSLNGFKQRAGFQGYAILLGLDGDQELLRYSEQKVRTKWRV